MQVRHSRLLDINRAFQGVISSSRITQEENVKCEIENKQAQTLSQLQLTRIAVELKLLKELVVTTQI